MGNNNLYKIENTLRSIAKRYKSVKYSLGLAILFLMMGVGAFSEEVNPAANGVPTREEIATSRENLKNSVGSLQSKIDEARAENSKGLTGLRLELIQLMEQGDQVVKSPWSSWQFGLNYMYSKWNGTYKGRGDKAEKYPYEGIFTRSKDPFERYTSPKSPNYGLLPTSTDPYSATTSSRKGLRSGYGIASTTPKQEPLTVLNVDASIKPKDVYRDPVTAPTVDVKAPVLQALNVPNLLPPSLDIPEPVKPNVTLVLPTPNTNPFTDFCFTCGTQNGVHQTDNDKAFSNARHNTADGNDPDKTPNWADGKDNKFWTGFNPVTGLLTPNSGINGNIRNFTYSDNVRTDWAPRTAAALYFNKSYDTRAMTVPGNKDPNNMIKPKPPKVGFEAKNIDVYVAGNVSDKFGNKAGKTNGNHDGAIGIHTVWDGTLTNIRGYLYGRANFLSIETWHAGNLHFENVSINIERNDAKGIKANENTLFYIYPATYETIASHNYWAGAPKQRGGFIGEVNAKIPSNRNIVYSVLGAQGSFEITSTGKYELEGADNIVYSGLGYSPNFNNLKGSGIVEDLYGKGLTPSLKLDKAPESYGDGNVVMLFNNRINLAGKAVYDSPTNSSNHYISNDGNGPAREKRWRDSGVGIYQGEIRAKAIIGNQLNMNNSGTQTAAGNTSTVIENGTPTEKTGDANYVENNIGIYARSGQRGPENGAKIIPSKDLGAKDTARNTNFDKDEIHSLQVNDIDISFGKYSKNGIMMVSENGTVLDVAMDTNKHEASDPTTVPIMNGEIKDHGANDLNGKISYNDADNEAATGTIIAYSDGTWKNTIHGMKSDEAKLFEGKSSEINIGRNVVLTARYKKFADGKESTPVAYVAKNSGKVTAHGTTKAKGFGAILGYAESAGKVTLKKEAEAVNEWVKKDAATKPYLYNNIGGYAKGNGSTVDFEKDLKINGMAGFADGAGATVNLRGNANKVQTGKSGGLAAINGGVVNFGGGDIYHETTASTNNVGANNQGDNAGDHSQSTPFYADKDSHINFTGATNLNISDGVLIPGTKNDYAAAQGTTTKYNGMSNVTVNLTGNNVVLASNNGIDKVWDGTTIADLVKNTMKVAAFNANGHSYKIYYINGTFKIDSNINVGSASDDFNKVGLSREVVTINSGRTVSSTVGKGLAMGSNDSANKDADNSKTQFINNGTVDIKGGSLSAGTIGLNISYGQIHNKSTINVENGIGAYGINGSTLTNDTTGKINITTQGVGMAAFTSANTLQTYGTDKKISDGTLTEADKTFEIINKGQVTVNGNKSVGLYGDTNGNSSKLSNSNGVITNSGKLTLTGDESVGIVSKRATVNLSGTGNSDIVVGKKGIGVYAEKSKVKFNSDYGVEVKDGGTGVFVKNDGSNIIPSGANTLKLKYSGSNTGTGVGLFYEGGTGANLLNTLNVKLMDTVGTTGGLIGVYTAGGGKLTNTATISGDKGYGIISKGTEIVNQGTVTLTNALTSSKPSVGLLTQAGDNITNEGTVTVGNNSVGVYGKKVLNKGTIAVGDGGTGIYSEGGNVDLDATSKINTGANKAVGVFTKGAGQTITASAGSTMTIGNSSFGFLNEGKGNTINSNVANQTLGTDGTYIYSSDKSGTVNNNTTLTSTGSYNYGLYSAGTVKNNADINFGTGLGNVGVYSTHGGRATNLAGRNITVGASYIDPNNSLNNRYAVGMAAGFTPTDEEKRAGKTPYTGNIVNEGTINVNGQYSIGMYGTGVGTKVYNGTPTNKNATINLGASNTTGMYLDNGAYGYNYGTIRSTGSGLSKVVGIVVKNGSTIENHGKIELTADDAVGILSKGDTAGNNPGIIKNYGTFNINGATNPNDSSVIKKAEPGQDLGKSMGGVKIDVPKGSSVGTITVNGKPVVPTLATTSAKEYRDMEISKIGMYIDTSNKRFTNPINGLSALSRLKTADLIIGNEAAQSTTSKYIQVDQKILKPYNEMIKKNPQIKKWNIYAGALTWMATVSQDKNDGTMKSAYLAKVPYTHWAGNESIPVDKKDTYNFLDGLEQRYGVEGIGTRENGVFQKLNGIGKNEQILFFQAVDEMMGHQYANVQQRVQSTGIILDKEFKYLRDEWRTASKDSNKIKVFGTNGEYKTDTAGVIDYKNYGYGVAYLHEDEDIKLGRGIGWYTGIVHNTFKFKDIGKSKEQMLQAKVGLLKSVPFDDNNSLNWTISGDIFVGRNTMHRKFLVVDEIFNAKSKYYTYGIGVKNEIGKEFRLSEDFTLRPYAALKLEYGRVSKIREKSGEIKLEVKQNQYFSVRPEIGAELGFKHYFGMKALKTTLGVAYENELGRVANGKNKARVVDTSADWFNIRGEKEDRRGNVKFDLNVGVDNTRVGVTANVGYDTKGKNLRGGLGLRVIF
ncbi:autotransporter-associated N-terminal domain-containing protein [Fusobacterium nucleatum]|uniref:autotransporter-associated N-terminal domain-containing protein n=1 Tax=Fusobacterium nucleatum TaxID=851 RepID=UPI0030D51D33